MHHAVDVQQMFVKAQLLYIANQLRPASGCTSADGACRCTSPTEYDMHQNNRIRLLMYIWPCGKDVHPETNRCDVLRHWPHVHHTPSPDVHRQVAWLMMYIDTCVTGCTFADSQLRCTTCAISASTRSMYISFSRLPMAQPTTIDADVYCCTSQRSGAISQHQTSHCFRCPPYFMRAHLSAPTPQPFVYVSATCHLRAMQPSLAPK